MSLTPGFGESVIQVIEFLCGGLLKYREFRHKPIIRVTDNENAENEGDGDDGDKQENDEMSEDEIEDELDAINDDEDNVFMKQALTSTEANFINGSQREMVISNLDAQEWRMELERVGPRLRITSNSDFGWASR